MVTLADSEAFRTLIISRGRGRGHAVPDMAIASELASEVPNLAITFASYSGGAEAYRSRSYPVVDLDAPDEPPFLEMIIKETRLLGHVRPRLVIAHEEFPALIAARIINIPCVFITDFFLDPNTLIMQALEFADDIVFTADRGLYTEPPHLHGRVHYVGPAVRKFRYALCDRRRARMELGLPETGLVVLCQPGNWPEAQVPLVAVLEAAWQLLPDCPKHLVWLAGRDYDHLLSRFSNRADWTILKEHLQIDQLIVASDVVVTKSNRLTVYETASLGIPSISVSNGANWADDVAVRSLSTNRYISVKELSPDTMASLILAAAAAPSKTIGPVPGSGITGVVRRIVQQLETLGLPMRHE